MTKRKQSFSNTRLQNNNEPYFFFFMSFFIA